MRQFVIPTLVLISLVACDGHGLDSPVSTCKSVTSALAGNKAIVWHNANETESGDEKRVTLELSLAGQEQTVGQVVCIYGPSIEGISSNADDYRHMYGDYANTPTALLINGQSVPEGDLIQAINLATVNTAKAIGQDVAARTEAMINRLNQK